jgi:hypothetical protein
MNLAADELLPHRQGIDVASTRGSGRYVTSWPPISCEWCPVVRLIRGDDGRDKRELVATIRLSKRRRLLSPSARNLGAGLADLICDRTLGSPLGARE